MLPTNVGSVTEEARMTLARMHLYDGETLRKLMQRAPGGSIKIEELGEKVGLSKSKVGMLLSGERPTVTREKADDICRVLGVHRGALFFEPLPTPMGTDTTGGTRHEHGRAFDADADRSSQELGSHDGPIGPYRRRP
ncbi:helix-turn-helix domain-containing protein [Streptomyces griseofuscus]|uniref:helix-turn-helix domain-containing protein n=1 Tax=Streptomyces griseofuscus TaxID=146922 RepID=UPI003795C1F1